MQNSTQWLRGVLTTLLKDTEFHNRASTIPYDVNEIERFIWTMQHDYLLQPDWRKRYSVNMPADALANIERSHKAIVAAFEAANNLAKKLRIGPYVRPSRVKKTRRP